MKGLKRFLSSFDLKEFKAYFFISVLLIFTIVGLGRVRFTSAKYETAKEVDIKPSFAFFITDIGTQSQSIKLDNIVPSDQAYLYAFTVSNFKGDKKANVDLTYTIEVITTTNLPLNIKLYKNPVFTNQTNHTDTLVQNDDGVYFRHLLYNSELAMSYAQAVTDTYTLWIEFPSSYKNDFTNLNGVMDLIDVEIRAKQVVDV